MIWKKRKELKVESGVSGVLEKTARWILYLQRKGADRLNEILARMPIQKVKMALLIFCLLAGGASVYLVIGGITGGKAAAPAITIEKASVPGYFDNAGDAPEGSGVDKDTYAQLQAFKGYMDSLLVHDPKAYDSFMRTRPGLVDTVQVLEEIYLIN